MTSIESPQATAAALIRDPSELVASAWYTTEEVASLLKVDPSSLRRWRTARPPQGPPFVPVSDRVTRYSGADLIAYLQYRRIDPTAA